MNLRHQHHHHHQLHLQQKGYLVFTQQFVDNIVAAKKIRVGFKEKMHQ